MQLRTGPERSVAATKTYTASLGAIAALAGDGHDRRCPDAMERQLEREVPDEIAAGWKRLAVVGRGVAYGTAFEAALKLSELTGMVAAPYSTADFLHGPIAIVEPGFPILAIAPSGPTLEGIRELLDRASEADVTVITDAELPGRRIAPGIGTRGAEPARRRHPRPATRRRRRRAPRQGRRPPDRPQEGDADLMTQTGIRIDGVTKAYKNGPRAVDDVSLEVRQGEFMVLVGPSGCGKSTLLKLIAGIEETTAGTIHIGGATSPTWTRASATSRWSSRTTRSTRT